jgi:hypothetical protein
MEERLKEIVYSLSANRQSFIKKYIFKFNRQILLNRWVFNQNFNTFFDQNILNEYFSETELYFMSRTKSWPVTIKKVMELVIVIKTIPLVKKKEYIFYRVNSVLGFSLCKRT